MRCDSGIWPPSKPTRKPSLRAFCPFCPRPEVLPRPDPVPRPTRSGLRCAPGDGLRSWSCIDLVASLVLLVRARAPDLVPAALRALERLAFDGDQEVDGLQHPANRRVVRQLACLVELAEAERLDSRLDRRIGADRALHQRRLDRLIRHWSTRRVRRS